MQTIVTYPVPAYANPPIQTSYYKPQRFVISDITRGATTTVTTTTDHDYVIGQAVRFVIPSWYGANEFNEMQSIVLSIPADDQVEVQINSSNFTAFNSAGTPNVSVGQTASPQILAIGDYNSGYIADKSLSSQQTNINGSFINISPE